MDYRCPMDGSELERQTTPDGVAYACPVCRGRMVNIAALKRRPELRDGVGIVWSQAMRTTENTGRACPQCGAPMSRAQIPGTVRFIELCKPCQALWLEGGNEDALPHREQPPRKEERFSPQAEQALRALEAEGLQQNRQLEEKLTCERPRGLKFIAALLLLPVKEDDYGTERSPLVTWVITALCVLPFLALLGHNGQVAREWGYIAAQPLRHGGLTLLTTFFLHTGIIGIICNAYYLMAFGGDTEDHLGPASYALMLMVAHFAGLVCAGVFRPTSITPLTGAGAAVSAILVYYVFLYPRRYLQFVLILWFKLVPVRVKTWWFFVAWAAAQLYLFSWHNGAPTALAHLGGASVGYAWVMMNRARIRETQKQELATGGSRYD